MSTEEGRLRRALKTLAEEIEYVIYVAAPDDDVTLLRRIVREAREALVETLPEALGG